MRILIDLSYCNPERVTGVSNYALRLVTSLLDEYVSVYLLGTERNKEYLKHFFPNVDIFIFDDVYELNLANYLFYYNSLKMKLRSIYSLVNADVFLLPFFTLWSIIPTGLNNVAVIHDVQPFSFNGKIKNVVYKYFFYKNLKKCCRIVTISNYSKSQILKLFPISNEYISVIYNSIITVDPQPIKNLPLPDKYILDVNSMEEYKNHLTLVKAFERICDKIPHSLVIKSRSNDYWKNYIAPYIEKKNLSKRIILIDEDLLTEELAYLFTKASLFVSTSLMEGFGFTPIEAAIYKTPVITSQCAALKETTQGELYYYSPAMDYDALRLKILEVLKNPPSQKKLETVSMSLKNIYSPNNQVRQFITLFKSII